jgi:hypothetical protein
LSSGVIRLSLPALIAALTDERHYAWRTWRLNRHIPILLSAPLTSGVACGTELLRQINPQIKEDKRARGLAAGLFNLRESFAVDSQYLQRTKKYRVNSWLLSQAGAPAAPRQTAAILGRDCKIRHDRGSGSITRAADITASERPSLPGRPGDRRPGRGSNRREARLPLV